MQECQVEDSGTESDDETEKEEADDADSEAGDISKFDTMADVLAGIQFKLCIKKFKDRAENKEVLLACSRCNAGRKRGQKEHIWLRIRPL